MLGQSAADAVLSGSFPLKRQTVSTIAPTIASASSPSSRPTPSSDTHPVLIDAVNITRRAPLSGKTLLQPVSLQVRGGDKMAVVGPSGAGKSVLLRLLASLDAADGGTLSWRGAPVTRGDILRYRRQVAYLKQRAAMLDGSVEDNLRAPFALQVYRNLRYREDTVLALLHAAGRDASFLHKSASELSGGEAQIAALVRVLQLEPTVLLLDEPTASLDPASAVTVEAMVARWYAEPAQPARAYAWVSTVPARSCSVRLAMRAAWAGS